jgi:heme/copper-type cytochrome/quinol oxidase subunit 3
MFLYAGKPIVEPLFHTNLVRKGFKIGFILFIISEIMFFFGFFWGFFHSSISPTIQIGAVWPPVDVEFITVKGFAIANTVILLTSGATLTVAHYAFELIPQKRNKLFESNVPFTESEESFEVRLNAQYTDLNKFFFNSAKLEAYWMPFVNYFAKVDGMGVDKTNYQIVFPFNTLFNPFQKYFDRNYGLRDTETLVKIYINLMLDATLLLAVLFMIFQGTEYFISPVNINTGIYGSTFYMITGLHGAHVFIGSCFLLYCRTAVAPLRNLRAIYTFFY